MKSRSRHLSDKNQKEKDRKKHAADRARRWRESHPKEWAEIQRRSRERAKRKKIGVEVELAI